MKIVIIKDSNFTKFLKQEGYDEIELAKMRIKKMINKAEMVNLTDEEIKYLLSKPKVKKMLEESE